MGQVQNLLCNKWVRHPNLPVRFETAHPKTYFCPHTHGRSAQGAPPSICLCANKPTVKQREYKKSACVCPATTSRICERTFTFYVHTEFQYITSVRHIYIYAGHFRQIVSLDFKPGMHLKKSLELYLTNSHLKTWDWCSDFCNHSEI